MKNRTRLMMVAAPAVCGLAALRMMTAGAHYPEIAAAAECRGADVVVRGVASSWSTGDGGARHNDEIVVAWDGKVVAKGRFDSANDYRFTIEFGVPADGREHVIRATAVAPFGMDRDRGFEGTFREAVITTPVSCLPTTTSGAVTASTAPATAPPSTTTASTTPSAPQSSTTTTAPVGLLGQAVVQPALPATPVPVQPRFTG